MQWNACASGTTFRIYWLMGKLVTGSDLANISQDLFLPLGSTIEYHPISAKDRASLHQFGKQVLPGIFMGYALYAGKLDKGDILVADAEELREHHVQEVYEKRINAKEVIVVKDRDTFIFSCANGMIKLADKSQSPHTDQIRQRPEKMEEHSSDHPREKDYKSDLTEHFWKLCLSASCPRTTNIT